MPNANNRPMGENLPNLVTLGGVKHEKTHFAFF
jgi:hypothetical protein